MTYDEIRTVIADRINNPNARHFPDPWWKKEIDTLTADLGITLSFIQHECTDEELFWLSEIFDELIQKTQSTALLECLHKRSEIIQDSKAKESVLKELEEASSLLS